MKLELCPLCGSGDIHAYQIGWAVITCRGCHLTLSRSIGLKELAEIWNTRAEIVRRVPEQVKLF